MHFIYNEALNPIYLWFVSSIENLYKILHIAKMNNIVTDHETYL